MTPASGEAGSRRIELDTARRPRSSRAAGVGAYGQAWITIVAARSSKPAGSRPRRSSGPRLTVILTAASPTGPGLGPAPVPASPSAASSSAAPVGDLVVADRQVEAQCLAARPQSLEVLVELDHHAAPGAGRLEQAVAELEAAVGDVQVRAARVDERAVQPDRVVGAPDGSVNRPVSRPPIARSGPAALATVSSHSSAGSLRQVIPPPTWRLNRAPSATNVRIRMLEPSRPSGPSHRAQPVYGPRRTGSRVSRISIARIFGAPVIEPPGNAAASRSNGVLAGGQPPGHGRDEVLDGAGPLEPAQPRDADRARPADPPEVVAQDVDDHHVLGPVLGAGQQLGRERPVLLGRLPRAAGCP